MNIEALQTVRLEKGAHNPPKKVAELMEKHGYLSFFGPNPAEGRPEGGRYPKVPNDLAKALIDAKLAVEVGV